MESNEHCETVQENNLMYFRDRPLSEALAKYEVREMTCLHH